MSTEMTSRVPLDISACPHLNGFDPTDAKLLADPYPHLKRAREEEPVFYSPEFDMWMVTKYDLVRGIIADTEAFSNAELIRTPDVPASFQDRLEHFPVEENVVTLDPPEHGPVRKLAQKGFTVPAVKAREGEVRARAQALIDDFIEDGQVDIVQRYCNLIPLITAASMLGVEPDAETVDKLRTWTRAGLTLMVEANEEKVIVELAEDMLTFDSYIRDLIRQRREDPTDDVLSLLVHATDEDGQARLTEKQLIETAAVILVGGSDTTAGTISRAVQQLLSKPELWARLRESPSLAPAVFEETMRMFGTVQGIVRVVTRDVELAGHTIPEGSFIYLSLASADRDETIFEHPDEFDIDRPKSELTQHLAFGRGTHFCLGATFARAEGRIALEVLVERIPDLRLVDPDEPLDLVPSMFVNPMEHLQVAWDVR